MGRSGGHCAVGTRHRHVKSRAVNAARIYRLLLKLGASTLFPGRLDGFPMIETAWHLKELGENFTLIFR